MKCTNRSISKYNLQSKQFFLYKTVDFVNVYIEKHHNILKKYFMSYDLGEYLLSGGVPVFHLATHNLSQLNVDDCYKQLAVLKFHAMEFSLITAMG